MSREERNPTTWAITARAIKFGLKYWKLIPLVFLLHAGFSAVFSYRAWLIKPLLDGVMTDKAWHQLGDLALIAAALAILIAPLRYFSGYLAQYLAQRIVLDIRNKLNNHILKLPMSFFHRNRSGDMVSKVINDVQVAEFTMTFLYDDAIKQPFLIIGGFATAFMASWELALIVLVLLPLIALPLIKLGMKVRKIRKKSLEQLSNITDGMVQSYSGIRVVKAFNAIEYETGRFEEQNTSFFRKMLSVARKKLLGETIVEFFNFIAAAGFMMIGGYLAVEGRITPGELAMFVTALIFINSPMKELTKNYTKYQESLGACQRIFDLLDTPCEPTDPPSAVDFRPIEGGIEYRGVSFAYESEPVLADINFKALPGDTIAVVGRSGAGKSTLVDILCRFNDSYAGAVEIDGNELRNIRRASLLDNIAIVSQETFLFNSTIVENIRYGKRNAPIEEVVAAAKATNIHSFIETLEKGYDTDVGERGVKLSGGQRQRIAIARAILKNPAILILDEATSALDTESERLVQGAINNLLLRQGEGNGRRIAFIIAHRLSTVKSATRIVVLDKGRIIECGSHEELLNTPSGTYALLYNELQ